MGQWEGTDLTSQVSRHHMRLSKPKDFSSLTGLEFYDYGKEEEHSHKYHKQVVPRAGCWKNAFVYYMIPSMPFFLAQFITFL